MVRMQYVSTTGVFYSISRIELNLSAWNTLPVKIIKFPPRVRNKKITCSDETLFRMIWEKILDRKSSFMLKIAYLKVALHPNIWLGNSKIKFSFIIRYDRQKTVLFHQLPCFIGEGRVLEPLDLTHRFILHHDQAEIILDENNLVSDSKFRIDYSILWELSEF